MRARHSQLVVHRRAQSVLDVQLHHHTLLAHIVFVARPIRQYNKCKITDTSEQWAFRSEKSDYFSWNRFV
jgi:hypothetical protein